MEIGGSYNAILNKILGKFSIPKANYSLKPLSAGYINDTYMVSNGEGQRYILQRINPMVFENIPDLMGNIEKALSRLEGPGYTKIKLISTNSGTTFLENKQGYWRLMTYIEQTTTHNTTTDIRMATEAGRIIGQFHLLLQDAKIDDYVDTIPRFHDLSWRKEQFQEAIETADAVKKETAMEAISFAEEVLAHFFELTTIVLPLRVCHNDTKFNNILFSKRDNRALCLIDLDTIMKGHFYYDFGDALRTLANTAPEDEQDHSKISFEKTLFESFVDGLASVDPFLTVAEIETLHLGGIVMPFLHGLRALTDYLNGNIYYKVSYENQNLDRCLSLFDFTKKAIANEDYMKEVIRKKLRR